jgi:asparagine synthase (glutamine-hydrolysing)
MSAIAGRIPLDVDGTGIEVAADARLDEREALARELSVRASDASDAELIRSAYLRWGPAAASHLLGDFAFVLWDRHARRLVAARDHLGVKPLHYHTAADRFTFATYAPDLFPLGVPRMIDEARVADALVPELEGLDAISTFYRGVNRLPPAHVLVAERGSITLSRYWRPDGARELKLADDAAYAEAFLATFRQAVACRLDDGAAAMLSGGLDSSAIVGMGRSLGPLTTISAVSPEGAACEESAHVRAVLALGGPAPVLVRPRDAAAFEEDVDRFLASWAEPFDYAMILPILVYAAAARAGVRAVLDGVDGDAVASLEPDHVDALLRRGRFLRAAREVRGLAAFYRTPQRGALVSGLRRAFVPMSIQRAVRNARRPARRAASLEGSLIHPDLVRRARVHDRLDALEALRPAGRSLDPRARQAAELAHPYLASALERYARAAASQGVDARHPFLDRRVVDLCLALPWDQKVRDGWSKWIVRRAMDGCLPDAVRWRRGRWVRLGPTFLDDAIASRLASMDTDSADTMSALAPYIDLRAWRDLLARFAAQRDPNDGGLVWETFLLSRWLRANAYSVYDARARRVGAVAPSPQGPRATTVASQHEQPA